MARTRDGYDAVPKSASGEPSLPTSLAVCNKSFGLNQFQIIYAGRPRLGASRMQPSRRTFRRMNSLLMIPPLPPLLPYNKPHRFSHPFSISSSRMRRRGIYTRQAPAIHFRRFSREFEIFNFLISLFLGEN